MTRQWISPSGVVVHEDGEETHVLPSGSILTESKTAASGAITGTITPSATEAEIVSGGKTIIITLTEDTWVTAGAAFNAQRQNIINGLDSAQSEGTGWDAEVKAKEVVGAVVRTNDTTVTITLSASALYDITAQETITVTIPATALVTSTSDKIATPTFNINAAAAAAVETVVCTIIT